LLSSDKPVTIDQVVPVALILMLGTAVQAAVGFGAGLLAVPLLVWLGIALPPAVGLLLAMVIVQTGLNCWQHRSELPWRSVLPMFLLRCLGLPVGLALMYLVSELDPRQTKQAIGVALLTVLGMQLWWKVPPQDCVHWIWTVLAGISSGILAGMVGMGGPPLVLWVMAHDWPPRRQRSFLWLAFLLQVPLQSVLLSALFGKPLVLALICGGLLTPAGLAGAWLGGWIGDRLSRPRLRLAMTLVLLGIAIYSIVSPQIFTRNRGGGSSFRAPHQWATPLIANSAP
jgi:uncharacterized membrane protein YfcA